MIQNFIVFAVLVLGGGVRQRMARKMADGGLWEIVLRNVTNGVELFLNS